MKKFCLLLLLVLTLLATTSCTTVIPSSTEAEEKMEKLGYDVELTIHYGEDVKGLGIQQVTFLFCDKEEDFLQAYFFANEEDTDTFYKSNHQSLETDVEVVQKNRYSIYRGTKSAVEDFLS